MCPIGSQQATPSKHKVLSPPTQQKPPAEKPYRTGPVRLQSELQFQVFAKTEHTVLIQLSLSNMFPLPARGRGKLCGPLELRERDGAISIPIIA